MQTFTRHGTSVMALHDMDENIINFMSRKVFVTRGWLDAQDKMRFTDLIFTLHPKSIDTWAYR
ncbi:hypothetical protein PsorP6_004588 [Peronosclerospora sorghi]|uniref:Uncharacterized protein n=1 Tax=Peronosclerospora sorghi TaxID=230839 RepID=A0ACC0VPB7_9STRA|nr:hypothetical protein PsorP6_004588 [Peronosclerospora sorghi]